MHLRSDEKRFSIDGENRFFHIKFTLLNLRNPQFATEDNFLNLFGDLRKIFPTLLTFYKHPSFLHNIFICNVCKPKRRRTMVATILFFFLCFNLIMTKFYIFSKLITNLGQIENWRASFVVEYINSTYPIPKSNLAKMCESMVQSNLEC